MQNKILSFIINDDNELLLLRNNPADLEHGGDFWYTVTGGFEDYDKSGDEVVKREIKEEPTLDVKETLYLNGVFKYVDKNLNCTEYAYLSFVKKGEIILDKIENIDYEWCDLTEFLKRIRWFGDLDLLKEVLVNGMKRKLTFNSERIEEYDFNFETILDD